VISPSARSGLINTLKKTTLAAALAFAATLPQISVAETVPGTNLEVFVEGAIVGGSGRTISIRRLPVKNSISGAMKYYDVAFNLTVDSQGQVQFDQISQLDLSAMVPASNAFKAGIYQDPNGSYYELSGPSISADGHQLYSIFLRHSSFGGMDAFSGNLSTQPVTEQRSSVLEEWANLDSSHSFGAVSVTTSAIDPIWDYVSNSSILSGYQSGQALTLYQWNGSSLKATVVLQRVADSWGEITVN